MIFRRFHIDGFGIWRDLTLDDLDPGLNVFLAPNEGGKTTLMSFARAVLYGFRQRNHPERYEPLRGGKHGGYLEIDSKGKSYRIVRIDDRSSPGALRISGADGETLPERTLSRLLGGTTRELYENVFAFGLTELQKIDSLHNEQIATHIYSAGMAAAGTDPIGFRESLEARRREYYLPRGRNQRVSRRLDELKALQRSLEPLQQRPEEHAKLLQQSDALHARLLELNAELAARQGELDAARRARSCWADYEELLAAESSLEALGVPKDLAGDAAPADLLSGRQNALLRDAGRIRTALATVPRLRELRAAADKHGSDADAADVALRSHLQDLGSGWDVGRILATEAGLEQREAARDQATELREVEAEIDSIAARAAEAHDTYETIVNRRDPISREAVMLTWGVAVLLTLFSSFFMPLPLRLVATGAVAAAGFIAGVVVSWLRYRGRQQIDNDRLGAADRETTLWEQHRLAEESLGEKRKKWRRWLESQGLGNDLTLDGALDLLDRLREAQDVARKRQAAAASRDKALGELAVACGRVNALLTDLGRDTVPLEDEPLAAVEPIAAELEALQAELVALEEQQQRLVKEMHQHAQARAALRAGAGEEGVEALRARLESLDVDKIQRLANDAETAVAAIQAQRDGINEQLGGVAERIDHLEGDAELGELLLQREQARADLAEAVAAWAEYTATAALFDLAKQVYEEQRQPDVLTLASKYFAAMTRGVYARVLAPLGTTDLMVEESKGGKRKRPEALSRGTKEQLYLAMRLALAAVYAEQLVALPLIADDILVNFDNDRAAATAKLLASYAAEGNQVLAFTCHRHLAEVFSRQAPGARVVELPKPA